uniref:M14 family zinc carboxypeptidase n=1 Tax=Vibrio caribbeanicus TaxID=701175 RepID=UPI0030D8A79B
MRNTPYPIGSEGKEWQQSEREQWRNQTSIKRSYQEEVVSKIAALSDRFDVEQYGALSYDTDRYPVFSIRSKDWNAEKPNVLITGGVHGYETSGIHGALEFVNTKMTMYSKNFNIIVVPCVSPWGYETINRWNPLAIGPNRSFYTNSPAEESALLIDLVNKVGDLLVDFGLHETTATDESG